MTERLGQGAWLGLLLLGLWPGLAGAELGAAAWLAGCWSSLEGEAGSGELWTEPAGDSMLGLSRSVHDGRTVAVEYLRIQRREDARIELVALPLGQAETRFSLRESGPGLLVFENPDHDFPQRVIYRLEAPGRLAAAIEGRIDGQPRRVDFPMRRAACPGPRDPGN